MTMTNKQNPVPKAFKRKGGNFIPALCGVLGTLILVLVILSCIPLTLPRLFGYEIYEVVSGSMAPEIPVGSAIYVRPAAPEEIGEQEIIAFWRNGSVVTHRVLENHKVVGEFITKGDANEIEDFEPIAYDALIGRVERHYPMLGGLMSILSGNAGKAYLLCLAACGVMFNIIASRLRDSGREHEIIAESEFIRNYRFDDEKEKQSAAVTAEEDSPSAPEPKKPRRRKKPKSRVARIIRGVLMGLMLLIFTGSAGAVLYVKQQYRVGEELYEATAAQYTAVSEILSIDIPAPEIRKIERLPETAPITVNFKALKEINPDVVGWIYCPDTIINYPVMQGETNDTYLHTSYDGTYNVAGSIFVEACNERDFSDCNYILYGHHMGDKSMFATLDNWQFQSYFDEHPEMWLLTPEQDYKISLYSAYTISAYDDVYTVYHDYDREFTHWLEESARRSAVESDLELAPKGQYIMLSTCAYVFDNARSVVHGMLRPIMSAGGEPIPEP